VGGVLLLAAEDHLYIGIIERVKDRADDCPGVAEDAFDVFKFETFDKGLCAVHGRLLSVEDLLLSVIYHSIIAEKCKAGNDEAGHRYPDIPEDKRIKSSIKFVIDKPPAIHYNLSLAT
jgi:hypothetical protein